MHNDKNKKREEEEIAISGKAIANVHTYGELIGISWNNKEFNRYWLKKELYDISINDEMLSLKFCIDTVIS